MNKKALLQQIKLANKLDRIIKKVREVLKDENDVVIYSVHDSICIEIRRENK